jgi:transcriptional regulator with XRE-family HTH domain
MWVGAAVIVKGLSPLLVLRGKMLATSDRAVYDCRQTVPKDLGGCQLLKTDPSATAAAELGQRVREARSQRGWSLAEVAARAGLSRAYINAIEHGRSKRPGAAALQRLEDVLGPLRDPPTASNLDIPTGLREFARDRRLSDAEVRMLASLRIRGQQPISRERWTFIYDALLASESIDQEAQRRTEQEQRTNLAPPTPQ